MRSEFNYISARKRIGTNLMAQLIKILTMKFYKSLSTLPVDKAVKLCNAKLVNFCKNSIPRMKVAERTVLWRNPQLTSLRRRDMSAKKQLLRAKRLHLADVINQQVCDNI